MSLPGKGFLKANDVVIHTTITTIITVTPSSTERRNADMSAGLLSKIEYHLKLNPSNGNVIAFPALNENITRMAIGA
jgi:hypothetical protein